MPASLGALGHHKVAPTGHGSHSVANFASHAAHQNVVRVQQVDDLARHAEAGNEDACATVDDGLNTGFNLARECGEQIDAKWLGCERAHLGHLERKFVGPHRARPKRADAACFADGSNQLVVTHAAHTGQHDWVLDFQEFGQACVHSCNRTLGAGSSEATGAVSRRMRPAAATSDDASVTV